MHTKQLQRIFKTLGNARRLAMVQLLLKRKELSVGAIASTMKLSITATSRHLTALANIDMLEKRQESLTVYYRIAQHAEPEIRTMLRLLL